MTSRRIRIGMLVVGIPAIAIAAWYAYGDIQQLEAPPLWALLPAGAANLASLWCSSRSWDVLFGDAVPRRVLSDAFYTSQLMKYTPVGGVAQAVGQAALARTEQVGTARAGTAMLVSKLTMVIAGGVFGPLLALTNSDLPGWTRLALLFTPAVFVLGRRGLLAWSLGVLRKVLPRTPDHTVLPDQRDVWVSVAWAVPGLAFAGLSFALLAIPAGLGVGWVEAVAGFSLAWVVGFLVIPIPSGLGVREAALGLLVGGDPGAKLVAAVLFRAVAIATEALMFGAVRVRARRGAGG
jgi:hypothetical protein